MKLELKHLSMYLPYGLKTLTGWNNVEEIIGFKDETYFIKGGNVYAYGDIQDCKPILRPLSDLTENNELFGGIEGHRVLRMFFYGNINYIPYGAVNDLLKSHYDIHLLIPAKLAIDINTLEK